MLRFSTKNGKRQSGGQTTEQIGFHELAAIHMHAVLRNRIARAFWQAPESGLAETYFELKGSIRSLSTFQLTHSTDSRKRSALWVPWGNGVGEPQ
jgi:hypothetical protein